MVSAMTSNTNSKMVENGSESVPKSNASSVQGAAKRKKRQQNDIAVGKYGSDFIIESGEQRQKLVAFGKCYNYAIPETTNQQIVPSLSLATWNVNDKMQSHDFTDDNHINLINGGNYSLESNMTAAESSASTIPIAKWDSDIPPWIKKSVSSSDDVSSHVKQVASSFQSTLYLTGAGRIYQQGLLHGYCMPTPTRIEIPLPLKCIQIAAGRHFCLALLENGVAVASWGAGHFGQLGIGANYGNHSSNSRNDVNPSEPITFTSTPCIIERLLPNSNDSPIVSVAAGDWHALALTQSGRVWAWGCNRNLQCGRKIKNGSASGSGSSPSNAAAVPSSPAPTITVPLPVPLGPSSTSSSTNNNGHKISSFHVTHIAAGRSHSMIIAKESVVKTVLVNKANANQAISSTSSSSSSPSATTKTVTRNVVYCWGNSHHGQCGNTVTRRSVPGVLPQAVESLREVDICQISAGGNHSMALTAQGRILCWGSHIEGQLGIGVVATSASTYNAFMASQDDLALPNNGPVPTIPATSAVQCKPRLVSDLDFVAITAGQEWTKQQQSSTSLPASSVTTSSASGSLLTAIPRIRSIHAGPSYSAAINSLGQLYVWGSNDVGQLGIQIPPHDTVPYMYEDNNALRVVIADDDNTISTQATHAATQSINGPSSTSQSVPRPLHSQTFDSRHIILLPTRVDVVRNIDVQDVSCGPNHMWCIGHERRLADIDEFNKTCEHGKTLYEVQARHTSPSSSLSHSKRVATVTSTKPSDPPGLYDEETKEEITLNPSKQGNEDPSKYDANINNEHYQLPVWATNNHVTGSVVDNAAERIIDNSRNASTMATTPSSAVTLSTDAMSSGLRSLASTGTAASTIPAAQTCTTTDAEEITETEANDFDYDEEDDTMSRWSQSMTSMASNSYHQSPSKQSLPGSSIMQQPNQISHQLPLSSQSSGDQHQQQQHRGDDTRKTGIQPRGRRQTRGAVPHTENSNEGHVKSRGRMFMKRISDRLMRRKKTSTMSALDSSEVGSGVDGEESASKTNYDTLDGAEGEFLGDYLIRQGTNSDDRMFTPNITEETPNPISPVASSKPKSNLRSGVFGGLRKKES